MKLMKLSAAVPAARAERSQAELAGAHAPRQVDRQLTYGHG